MTYENQPPKNAGMVDSDNNIVDMQQFLQSGQVIAAATSSPDPVVPVGQATVNKFNNLAAWAGKFINSENEIIDLLNFLMSGAMKLQVIGTAPTDASYITKNDETANLPESVPLSGLPSGLLSNTTSTGVLNPRTIAGVANQTSVTNGNGVSGNPTVGLSSTLELPGTFKIGPSSAIVNNITNSASSVSQDDVPTMYAVQTAIGNAITTGKLFRGAWDASGGTFPATGGTGEGGAIQAGNWWYISVAGTLGGQPVDPGDQIFATVDDPGQTSSNWAVLNPRVYSVFGRINAVVALLGDYSIDKITNGYNNATPWLFSDFTGSGAPTASNDATVGYSVGSLYTDINTGYTYICRDAGEDSAVWESLSPIPPSSVTYVSGNGDDSTGQANNIYKQFLTIQAGADAVRALVSPTGCTITAFALDGAGPYGDLDLSDTFTGFQVQGYGDYVSAGDLDIGDSSASVGSGVIRKIFWNDLTITNNHDNVYGTNFYEGAFNNFTMDNTASATNGVQSGNNYQLVEFVGNISYFPVQYAKQLTSITERYIGCKFSGSMTLNGTNTHVQFIACQNTPTITYANGATSAQVSYINSLSKSYATIWMNTGDISGVSFAFTSSYQELTSLGTNFTLASPYKNFSMSTDGRLTYTGAATIDIAFSACMIVDNSGRFSIQLYKNGSPVSGANCFGLSTVLISGFHIQMKTNDYISIWAKRNVASTQPIVQVTLSAES